MLVFSLAVFSQEKPLYMENIPIADLKLFL